MTALVDNPVGETLDEWEERVNDFSCGAIPNMCPTPSSTTSMSPFSIASPYPSPSPPVTPAAYSPEPSFPLPGVVSLPQAVVDSFNEHLDKYSTDKAGPRDMLLACKIICTRIVNSPFLQSRAFSLFDAGSLLDFAEKLVNRGIAFISQKTNAFTDEDLAPYKLDGKTLNDRRKEFRKLRAEISSEYQNDIIASDSDERTFDLLLLTLLNQLKKLSLTNSLLVIGKLIATPAKFTIPKGRTGELYPILYLCNQFVSGQFPRTTRRHLEYKLGAANFNVNFFDDLMSGLEKIFDKTRWELDLVSITICFYLFPYFFSAHGISVSRFWWPNLWRLSTKFDHRTTAN